MLKSSQRRLGQMTARDHRRKFFNHFMRALLLGAALLAVFPLLSVFIYVLRQGFPSLNWNFFTQLPASVGELGGGMANALVGSILLIAMASLIGVPFGVLLGVYLSEYNFGKLPRFLRFCVDLLTSVPSIIVGMFVYALVVVPMHGFSAHAGAMALAIIMTPFVARTTEEMLKLVPDHIREAGLALGISRWKVTLFIVLKGSLRPVFTGVMLAIARVTGETAPLLFTSFNNRFWSSSLSQPVASLPVQIYTYAISPYDEWHAQAWAGAFVLVVFVLLTNLIIRIAMMGVMGTIGTTGNFKRTTLRVRD